MLNFFFHFRFSSDETESQRNNKTPCVISQRHSSSILPVSGIPRRLFFYGMPPIPEGNQVEDDGKEFQKLLSDLLNCLTNAIKRRPLLRFNQLVLVFCNVKLNFNFFYIIYVNKSKM